MNNKKKKIFMFIILSLFSIALVSFGTYAIWNSELLTGNSSISTGQIKMSYTESNELSISNALPMKDEEGKVLTDYFDFQVLTYIKTNKNDSTLRKLKYNIVLEPIKITGTDNETNEILGEYDSSSEEFEDAASYFGSLFKVYLTKVVDGKEEEVTGPINIADLNDYILKSQEEVFKNGKDSVITYYRLRIWMDENVDPSKEGLDYYTASYKFRVNVNSGDVSNVKPNLDTSGANAPELTSNMIPVYYDETNDVWRKADSSTNNNWYNYDKKMWANAVTVVSSGGGSFFTSNKNVSLSNVSFPVTFTSGGYNINNAYSMTTITVSINTAGTFGFKATVSSESGCDKLTVTVTKNGGTATTVANAISGTNSNTYSDIAAVGDVYVITAKYAKDSSGNSNNDNGVLDSFTYPANTTVTYTDSSTAGGTSGQDWTVSGLYETISGVVYGDSITYDEESKEYKLNNIVSAAISSSLIGKYVCPTVTDEFCSTPYKIVEASDTITKVDKYYYKTVTRDDLVNSEVGAQIPMEVINTMWVWIPRYKYTYFNSNTPQEIQIKFESGTNSTGTIKCTDAINQTDSDGNTISEVCTDTTNGSLIAGTSTYTHPAFTFGDTELTGLWIGKFASSSTDIELVTTYSIGESTLIIKPNVEILDSENISFRFKDARQMEQANNVYGFEQSGNTSFNWDGTLTGDTNKIDTHMMKNMEWGVALYLSHSKYGINKEMALHYPSSTGCGTYSNDPYSISSCSAYNTTLGQSASTTGNVYGIYDMNGTWTDVMGNMVDKSGNFNVSNALNWSTTLYPLTKYYDKYSYGTSNTEYTRGKLGDATKEMIDSSENEDTWYSKNDCTGFPYSNDDADDEVLSWLGRGFLQFSYYIGLNGSAFNTYPHRGNDNNSECSRVSLSIIK